MFKCQIWKFANGQISQLLNLWYVMSICSKLPNTQLITLSSDQICWCSNCTKRSDFKIFTLSSDQIIRYSSCQIRKFSKIQIIKCSKFYLRQMQKLSSGRIIRCSKLSNAQIFGSSDCQMPKCSHCQIVKCGHYQTVKLENFQILRFASQNLGIICSKTRLICDKLGYIAIYRHVWVWVYSTLPVAH